MSIEHCECFMHFYRTLLHRQSERAYCIVYQYLCIHNYKRFVAPAADGFDYFIIVSQTIIIELRSIPLNHVLYFYIFVTQYHLGKLVKRTKPTEDISCASYCRWVTKQTTTTNKQQNKWEERTFICFCCSRNYSE